MLLPTRPLDGGGNDVAGVRLVAVLLARTCVGGRRAGSALPLPADVGRVLAAALFAPLAGG